VAFQAADGYFAGFTAIGGKAGVRYNIYGRDGMLQNEAIPKEVFLEAAGFPVAQAYGYEFFVPLEFDALLPSTDDAGRTVVQALKTAPQHVRDQLCAALRQQLDQTKQQYMNRLDERKQQLQRRRHLSLAGQALGPEPTNEHEVLILTGKMEAALGKQLHEFMVLEHTPQIDIDGILRIRREAGLHLQEAATVEFEFDLPNFFKHQHPIPITEYIICWTVRPLEDKTYRFGAKGIHEAGPLTVEVASLGWMKVLRFPDHMIYVLPLEQFPGLSIEPGAAAT
jgi:hypothetical protein